jgi:hypothetical protein
VNDVRKGGLKQNLLGPPALYEALQLKGTLW